MKIEKFICRVICKLRYIGFYVPDKIFVSAQYYLQLGEKLNLKSPKTFSEKLQWMKIYDHNELYHLLVDKYRVKEYVAQKIGSEYIIKTLAVWDTVQDIDINILPDRFVLKTTNGGGSTGVVICKEKNKFDLEEAKRKLQWSLDYDIYRYLGEWAYKGVKPRIIAEEYIEPRPDIKDLPDYKFFCFDGVVRGLFVATERQNPNEEVKFDFFDADYNHLPFRQGHDHAKVTPPKPDNFELMKEIAAKLSKGIPHARIDLYDLGDKVFFGEITMYHFGGVVPFEPAEWDKRFGDMINLPVNN